MSVSSTGYNPSGCRSRQNRQDNRHYKCAYIFIHHFERRLMPVCNENTVQSVEEFYHVYVFYGFNPTGQPIRSKNRRGTRVISVPIFILHFEPRLMNVFYDNAVLRQLTTSLGTLRLVPRAACLDSWVLRLVLS